MYSLFIRIQITRVSIIFVLLVTLRLVAQKRYNVKFDERQRKQNSCKLKS